MKTLIKKINRILKDRGTRRLLTRIVSVSAALVVFVTTYALVLPAITMETEAQCGIEAHQHSDSCYEDVLVCGLEESDGHTHDDSCYSISQELTCEIPKHQHDKNCYDEDGDLQCKLSEHDHTDNCYKEVRELTCTLEESKGHHHTDACYEKNLICGKEVHTHSSSCYEKTDMGAVAASEGYTAGVAYEVNDDDAGDDFGSNDTEGLEVTDDTGYTDGLGVAGELDDADAVEETGGPGNADTLEETNDSANTDAPEEAVAFEETGDPDDTDASEQTDDPGDTDSLNVTSHDDIWEDADNAGTSEAADFSDSSEEADSADPFQEADNTSHSDWESPLLEESAAVGTTNVLPENLEDEELSDGYVPQLDSLKFDSVLNDHTAFYYFHPEEGEEVPANSVDITSWKLADENTELAPTDLVKAYLAYTIPAGSLNETNQVARYRLPSNLHLTEEQILAINSHENGIAAGHIDPETNIVPDEDAADYSEYLGAEAVEGIRRPDQVLDDGSGDGEQEYISATVKAENVFDEEGLYGEKGAYLGQDLIFVFSPYTIQKNQNTYDKDGNPTARGEKVTGWFAVDVNMDQIDWSEPVETILAVDSENVSGYADSQNQDQNQVQDQSQESVQEQDQSQGQESAQEQKLEQEQEQTAADDNIQSQENVGKTTHTALQRIEKTAYIVFSAEGKDENNNKIHEISAELKLVQENEIEIEDENQPIVDAEEQVETPESTEVEDPSDEKSEADQADTTDSAERAESAEDSESVDADSVLEENKEEQTEKAAIEYKDGTLEANGSGYKITMEYKADARIPENAYLHVTEITRESDAEAYEACLEEARKSVPADGTRIDDKASRFFDIEILIDEPVSEENDNKDLQKNDLSNTVGDHDNTETESPESEEDDSEKIETEEAVPEKQITSRKIEPAAPVSVNIQLFDTEISQKPEEFNAEQYKVVHIAEDKTEEIQGVKGQIIESEEKDAASASADKESNSDTTAVAPATEVQFEAESFSIYGVVYTVDFHWEVDGRTYEFALSGGDSISLHKLVDVLGIIHKDSSNPEEDIINGELNDSTALNALSLNENPEIDRFINDIEKIEFSNESLIKTVQITESVTVSELKKQFKLETEYSAELTEEQIAEMEAKQFTPPDWALMVLKHFDTEEALTVTMKDGEVLTIKVTDPVTDTAPANMQRLTTVDTRSQGVKMWLFDYDLTGKLDHKDNKANQQSWNVPGTFNTYSNYGINSGSDLKFLGWGAGNSEKSYTSAGNTGFGINDFTGLDEDNTNRIRALQGIVQNELVGGYPVLQNGESLNYLFDPTLNTADRNVYGGNTKESGNITGLFELDNNGYYIYDSDEHYAELGKNGNSYTNNFTVYTSTLAQTNKNGNNHNPVRAVGFFPFDSYSHVYNDLKYENDYSHYDDYGTLYVNPDGDQGNSGLNHHIGVAMEMEFIMPKGGETEDGDPIQFKFSGDDDMWVFIDDQLVLDIGGLHQPVDGVIDFSTGKATITGKATVSGHPDNTGSAAIGVAQNVTDNRGNNFEFYPSLGLTDGDGKTHTMKIFYLERGGCDSNCMISFNLPLVKGKGDVTIAKYDSTANPVVPLPGVKFGIYSNPQCTELIEEVTSSSTGLLDFSDLGIKNDDQEYYIKETQQLPGYKPNDTVYTLKAENNGTNGYTFGVYVYNEEGVYNDKIDTIGNQPALPVIYNEERKPIDLTVEKVWQKPTMEAFTPTEEDNLSATFKVQRYVRSEGERVIADTSQPVTFKVYRIKNTTTVQAGSDYTFKGGTEVYIDWKYANHYYNGNYSEVMHYKENINDNYKNKTNPVIIRLPQSGTANIYIRDENINTNYGDGVTNISVNGTPYSPQNTTEHFSTDWEIDDTYNDADTCPELSLPEDKIDADHPWKGKFSNLPLYKIEGGVTYYYKYYIIEVDSIDGYETIYIDGEGNHIESPSSLATDESNTSSPQVIINRKLIDIPVEKTWPDYDDDEYTWTAKFQLDYRNVPLDGDSEEDGEEPSGNDEEPPEATTWPLYEPAQYVEISKGDTEQKFFENLPMYYTDEDGTTWRREYSVREIEYGVWRVDEHGIKIEPPIVSKGQNGTTGFEYTLWYRQDAGEDYNDDGVINEADYVISVENMLAHREVSREIDISLNKTWPAGTTYATSSDAKAIFKLKRYVVEEYRNYENVPNSTSWVDITLETGDGKDQTLRVPQGQGMYIRGYLKGGTKNQNISLTCSAGRSIPPYSDDNSSNPDQKAFSIGFTADTSKRIQLQSGAEYVSGGIHGFHLSDTNSMLPAEVDRHFSEEFELNSSNGWHAAFEDLPFVEVVQMNDGKTATTFVYSYYFEEIECVPETFYALFTDGNGQVLLGDENNRIVFSTDIAASNLPIGFDILKVDITSNSIKLPGAIFTLRKLDEDDQLHYPVSTNNGTFPGTSSGTAETAQGTGKTSFEGLLPGYYEVSETKAPDGYVLLSDSAFYLKVEKSGDIKLLKKQTQDDRVILIEAGPNEMVGNATIDSSISSDGKTIIATVRNEPGAALPAAGGPGTRLYLLLGCILIVSAGALLIRRIKTS